MPDSTARRKPEIAAGERRASTPDERVRPKHAFPGMLRTKNRLEAGSRDHGREESSVTPDSISA
jgi:hypothetical protein